MAVRGVTFSRQTVSSNDDSHIYKLLLNGKEGATKGCKMTYSKDDIYVSDGYFFISNRLVEIPSTETISTPIVTTGTYYCRLVFEIDLSKTNTNSSFEQGYFKILSSASAYPDIVQEDLENGGNVYQLPFAKFTKTVNGIGTFVSELKKIVATEVNKTIFVADSGNDASGDGSSSHPFKTIQKAIDSLPKNLNGYTVEISIGFGVYHERVVVEDFTSGRLIIGKYGEVFTIVGGIEIVNSSFVETNIHQIERATGSSKPLFLAKDGSNVSISSDMILDGIDTGITGMIVENNSHVVTANNVKVTCNNCGMAITAQWCSFVSLSTIAGSNNIFGVSATQGAIISYKTDTLSKSWSNNADSGGLVLDGNNSSDLSGATIEL